jgi:hypothetical protein
MDVPALGYLFALEADIVEIAGIPQRVEVAFQGSLVVNVACLGKETGADGLGRDAAVTVNDDVVNEVALSQSRNGAPEKRGEQDEPCQQAPRNRRPMKARKWSLSIACDGQIMVQRIKNSPTLNSK